MTEREGAAMTAPDIGPMDGRTHSEMLDCRHTILSALREAAEHRRHNPDWEATERMAVVDAANLWAIRHGRRTVSITEVEAVEHRAVGHIDYMPKLALYVAELVYGARQGVQP